MKKMEQNSQFASKEVCVKSKNFSLMYVEDDHIAQEWMQMMLEEDFKEFFQAFNGQEGLDMYHKHKPDIIISDINMPILDGLDMSKEIKEIDSNQPIIIMSAFDDKKTLLKAINIGIDYFTPKPIDMDILNNRLGSVVENLSNKIELESLRKKEMENLYNLAHYDVLTEVPNRYLFNITLDKALSRASRINSNVTLFFIDLDDFKQINDGYGHLGGDKVLKTIAKNIKDVIRVEDTFARISGDEFALIIENMGAEDYVDTLAQKIVDVTSKDIEMDDGKTIAISCSIGISRFSEDAKTKTELLRMADLAMYEAKRLGKACYAYYYQIENKEDII